MYSGEKEMIFKEKLFKIKVVFLIFQVEET